MALVVVGNCLIVSLSSALRERSAHLSSSFESRRSCWSLARSRRLWQIQRPLKFPVNAVHHQHTSSHPVRIPAQARRPSAVGESRRVFPVRALLLLSAATAIAFLQKKQGVQLVRSRNLMSGKEEEYVPNVMMAKQEEGATNTRKIDIHLHVWASPEEAKEFPHFPGQEPTLPGNVDYLLHVMEDAGVAGALITQPINHKFDHSYVSSVIKKYPSRFVGCCLADPSDGGGGVVELERLLIDEGYRAVRFNPYLWPSGERMTNEVGKAMFAKAGELGAAVGFMCFKGLVLHIEDIEELCVEFPETKVMIDHLGFCKPAQSQEEEEAWRRLLALSKFPQVYIKASAFFRVSREPFPYRDAWPLVQQVVETFGAKRVLWGSDFPYVAAECGYTNACRELPSLIASNLSLSSDEWKWILGRTALELFTGAWQEAILVT